MAAFLELASQQGTRRKAAFGHQGGAGSSPTMLTNAKAVAIAVRSRSLATSSFLLHKSNTVFSVTACAGYRGSIRTHHTEASRVDDMRQSTARWPRADL